MAHQKPLKSESDMRRIAAKLDVGVRSYAPNTLMGCNKCGAGWVVTLHVSGMLPDDWWICPKGCNKELEEKPSDY